MRGQENEIGLDVEQIDALVKRNKRNYRRQQRAAWRRRVLARFNPQWRNHSRRRFA